MKLGKFRKGQMAVVMTFAIATLLGVMALGADVGVLYYNWGQMQKAADAGALAGAGKLTGQPDSVAAANAVTYANGYACLNGVNDPGNAAKTVCPSPISVANYTDKILFTTVNAANTQVSISVNRTLPYFFGRVIGLNTGQVTVLATAAVLPTQSANGIFPAVFNCPAGCNLSTLQFGSPASFGVKFSPTPQCPSSTPPGGNSCAGGNWGWLDVGQGQGGDQLQGAIDGGGYSGTVNVGSVLNTVTGGKNGPVNQGWTDLLAQHYAMSTVSPDSICSGSNPDNIPPGDPLLVTVPVGDMSTCTNGNCNVTVSGFAEVYLTGITASGPASGATITGCFVSTVGEQTAGGSGAPALGSLGRPVLIQ